MVAPDALVCFTEHAQALLDQHASRRRWRGICAWLKRQRDAGIREQRAEIERLAAENNAKATRMARLRLTRRGIPK